ncbi:hypothetical protein IQ293_28565, partial [Streptomyces platensis]|nr:hypothetical protein [Streptomyces platensis]
MTRGDQTRWNDETQSWETGTPPPAPYTGPMPPRPSFAPPAGGPEDGGHGDGGADAPPLAAPPADPPPEAAAPRSTYPYPHPSAYTEGLPGPATDPYRTPETAVGYDPGARRRTGLIAGVAVAVIVAAVGGGYLLWGHD